MPENVIPAVSLSQSLVARNCRDLEYRLSFPITSFDSKSLAQSLNASVDFQGWYTTMRDPENSNTDYHVHVSWIAEDKDKDEEEKDDSEVRLQITYHIGPEQSTQAQAPFAENLIEWIGNFVTDESIQAHIHAEFQYPMDKWQSKLLTLPLKVPYASGTAAIGGIEVTLPSNSEGVHSGWLMLRRRGVISIQLFADRNLTFKGFRPQGDVDALMSIAQSLIVEKQQ